MGFTIPRVPDIPPTTEAETRAIGPAVPPDQRQPASKWSNVQQGNTFYNQYLIDTTYDTNIGLLMLPIAANSGRVSIVRTNAPYTIKRVKWTAERNGSWPTLPHWDTGDANEVLIDMQIIPANPMLVVGDIYVYRVQGLYVYQLQFPVAQNKTLVSATTPAETDGAAAHGVGPLSNFDKTIITAAYAAQNKAGTVQFNTTNLIPPN